MKPTLLSAILYGGLMAAATLSAIHPQGLMMKARAEALASRAEASLAPAYAAFIAPVVCPRTARTVSRAQIEAFAQARAAQACRRAEFAQMASAVRTQLRSHELHPALVRLQAASAAWNAGRR